MTHDNEEFEQFLRGFAPRRPRPLPMVDPVRYQRRRLIAAAILIAVAGGSAWLAATHKTPGSGRQVASAGAADGRTGSLAPVSSIALTRLALDDRSAFEAQMDRLAPLTFPCCVGPKSTLAALATE